MLPLPLEIPMVVLQEDFEWFKSENGHVFDPTDVNPKVFLSEQMAILKQVVSYWNASGFMLGAPGVQRCNLPPKMGR